MHTQVVSGKEDKRGNIHVEFMLAESGYLNENNIGFTPELLEKWHKNESWKGLTHNAHPSKNHPLAYESPPVDKSPLGQINYYRQKSAVWGFGTYVETKLRDIKNGQKRLNGIVRISDDGAKKAWRDGKFPKYASSSVFIMNRDENTDLITDAVPIACTSVDQPAFPVDVAGIYGTCEGGDECVTKLAESSSCNYCRESVLTSFENVFSYQKNPSIKESSMAKDDAAAAGKPTDPIVTVSDEITSADGKNSNVLEQHNPIDWEAKAKDFEAQLKDANKKIKDYETDKVETDKRFIKLEKDKLETKVRSVIDKVPLRFFEEKEENRNKEVEKYMKMYPKMTEEEIMDIVNDRFLMTVKAESKPAKGLKESGITNNAPLKDEENRRNQDTTIFKLNEVFG